jgi:hypothetical protein
VKFLGAGRVHTVIVWMPVFLSMIERWLHALAPGTPMKFKYGLKYSS